MSGGFPLGLEICNCNDQGTVGASTLGTTVQCGAGAYGSYVQLVASTPSDTCKIVVFVETNSSANNDNQEMVAIAVGSAGNEKVVISDLIISAPSGGTQVAAWEFPISIPAGSRISAAAEGISHTDNMYVSVLLFDGAFTQMEGSAGVDSIGKASAAQGTQVTSGAANAKGSYAQLIASTSGDYMGFSLGLCANNANVGTNTPVLIDVAIGASGSEIPILSNYFGSASSGAGDNANPFFPIPIPAGSRISARMQDAAGGVTRQLIVYGVYQ